MKKDKIEFLKWYWEVIIFLGFLAIFVCLIVGIYYSL